MSRRGTWNNAPERGKNEKREMARRLRQGYHTYWQRVGGKQGEWITVRPKGVGYANPQ